MNAPVAEARESRGRARHRRLVGTVAALAVSVLAVLPATPVSAANLGTSSEAAAAAKSGADWLRVQLDNGIPLEVFASPSWGTTLDAASALASTQTDADDPLVADIWDAAVADRESVVNDGTDDLPGRLAQMILLAYTLDKDPRTVGTGPGADLVDRLVATMRPAGSPDEGLYGAQDPTFDGVYRQGLVFAALSTVDVDPDPLALAWLLDQQCVGDFEGSWMSYRSDTSVPCVSDPGMWVGPDSNATGSALSGLVFSSAAETGVGDAIQLGLDWLDADQNADGGWGGYPWADTDPNSTAVVMQALIANNVQADPRFADQSDSQVTALLGFQLGASAPEADRGAFTYPGTGNSPSEMATVQAVVAAAGYPVRFRPTVVPEPPVTTTTTTTTTAPVDGGGYIPDPRDSGPRGIAAPDPKPIRLAG